MKKLILFLLAIFSTSQITFSQNPVWIVKTQDNSDLPNRTLSEITIDKNDIIWITADSIVIKYDWNNWEVIDPADPADYNYIKITKGGDGNVYLCSSIFYDSLKIYNVSSSPWEKHLLELNNPSLIPIYISCLAPSRDGGIWIVYNVGGLSPWETLLKLNNGIWSAFPRQITVAKLIEEDLEGNLWHPNFFPGGGVNKVEADSSYNFSYQNIPLTHGAVSTIETDLAGNIWMNWQPVPADDVVKWLVKFDGNTWTVYNQQNSNIPSSTVDHFVIDSLGNLWMSGNGLIKFDGINFTHYTPQNSGLYSTNITDIAIDEHNNKWILHPDGISIFNEDGVTPVELITFDANVNSDVVELEWITATETNNMGFEIERTQSLKEDEREWQVIGFVSGIGNSSSQMSYKFIDENLSEGKYFYRLKQIDFDGSFKYSHQVEVEIISLETFILSQNYPNPFNPITKINYTIPRIRNEGEFVTLKIYDILGNEVTELVNEEQKAGKYEVEFDSNNLPNERNGLSSGIYFYTLTAGSYIQTKKLILLK